jgi:hypothetical protein
MRGWRRARPLNSAVRRHPGRIARVTCRTRATLAGAPLAPDPRDLGRSQEADVPDRGPTLRNQAISYAVLLCGGID